MKAMKPAKSVHFGKTSYSDDIDVVDSESSSDWDEDSYESSSHDEWDVVSESESWKVYSLIYFYIVIYNITTYNIYYINTNSTKKCQFKYYITKDLNTTNTNKCQFKDFITN